MFSYVTLIRTLHQFCLFELVLNVSVNKFPSLLPVLNEKVSVLRFISKLS